jgi:hypothetical protein
MVSISIPNSVLHRIDHLVTSDYVVLPGSDRCGGGLSTLYSFVSPTVLYPVEGTPDRYLIAVYGPGLWTLVGLDYLACDYCEDAACAVVRDRAVERLRGVPNDAMVFAQTEVAPGIDGLPDPTPYLIHVDDACNFRGTVSLPIRLELFR